MVEVLNKHEKKEMHNKSGVGFHVLHKEMKHKHHR